MQVCHDPHDRREAMPAPMLPGKVGPGVRYVGKFQDGEALGGGSRPAAAPYRGVLFPAGFPGPYEGRADPPACFADLNLDQVLDAVVAKHDEAVLRPIFHATTRDEAVVRYRQAVFADMERKNVFRLFPPFCEGMRSIRANLAYAGQIDRPPHRDAVVLRAAAVYCRTVAALLRGLQSVELRSAGLAGLRDYLAAYAASPGFVSLDADAAALRQALQGVSYGTLFRDDKVTVRRYASEPDYTVTIRDRFARFRETPDTPPVPPKVTDEFSLNHIEASILGFVARLFPAQFRALGEFAARHASFIDDVVARCDREIGFYVAFLGFIEPMEAAGLPFCYPAVSGSEKETEVSGAFDLALAARLVREKQPVVPNDAALRGAERLLVVTGPNQGGKTTFARMFGQAHVLAGLGCPVPGRTARLFLPDEVFTHFERPEEITNLRGKLEDELVRLHQTCGAMTPRSVVVLNEVFNSTSLDDQVFLSTKVLEQILATDAVGVCVTFIDSLSTLNDKTVSMVSTVDPADPAVRTFRVVRKPADGLAYALSLAEKRGVTRERLRARVRP